MGELPQVNADPTPDMQTIDIKKEESSNKLYLKEHIDFQILIFAMLNSLFFILYMREI
jgi:hypothetical protein